MSLANAMRASNEHDPATLIINMPALGLTRTYSNGALKTGKILPDFNKTLQPVPFTLDFEKVS